MVNGSISFELSRNHGEVDLALSDVSGRVLESFSQKLSAGRHTIDFKDRLKKHPTVGILNFSLEGKKYSFPIAPITESAGSLAEIPGRASEPEPLQKTAQANPDSLMVRCQGFAPSVSALPSNPSAALEVKVKRPNIVVILADDMGYGDSPVFWDKARMQTPQIEKLAQKGIKYTNYHVNPLCTPTRFNFLSGQGSGKSGDMDLKYIPQMLKEQGYVNGLIGKWHLESHPVDRAFDKYIGFLGAVKPYNLKAGSTLEEGKTGVYKITEDRHITDILADEAINFVRSNQDNPFFLYLTFNAPHQPLYTEDRKAFSGRSDWLQKMRDRGLTDPLDLDYFAIVEHMDDRIGDVVDAIDSLNLASQTLVIFFSDNGPLTRTYTYSELASGHSGPYRAGKATVYEGGHRVPFVARWPHSIPAGTASDDFTCHWDLMHTFREMAGMAKITKNGPATLSGRSLLAHLQSGGESSVAPIPFPMSSIGSKSLTKGDYKMVEVKGYPKQPPSPYAEKPTNGPVLFNLKEDPGETTDISKLEPEKFKELKAEGNF